MRRFGGFEGKEVEKSEDRSGKGYRRSEEHPSELQSPEHLVCRLLLEKKITNAESPSAGPKGAAHASDGDKGRCHRYARPCAPAPVRRRPRARTDYPRNPPRIPRYHKI